MWIFTPMLSPTLMGIPKIGVSGAGRISHHGQTVSWPLRFSSWMPAWISEPFETPSTPTHSLVSVSFPEGLRVGTVKVPAAPLIPPPSMAYPDQFDEYPGETTGLAGAAVATRLRVAP